MKKKIININRPKISDTEIEGYKNFNHLMEKYSAGRPNLPKLKIRNILIGALGGVAVIIIIITGYISSKKTTDYTISDNETVAREAFIRPPVAAWDLPFESAIVSNLRDTAIQTKLGSLIRIPQDCLEDESGIPVTSGVEFRFREFPTPAEIFLSGIPMVYDSAGVRSVFESAGMIEIYASKDGRSLRIKDGSQIDISLVSATEENNYNLYYLDTLARNWQYMGKDKLEIKKNRTSALRSKKRKPLADTIDVVKDIPEPVKPAMPLMARNDKFHLTLDIVKGEFPELDLYGKTVFEIDDTYKPLNKKHAGITWEDVALTPTNDAMSYYLSFRAGKDSCRYRVRPVLSGMDYAKARVRYDSLYKQYQNALEIRKRNDGPKVVMPEQIIADSARLVEMTMAAGITRGNIMRSFSISNFGIWNCDRVRIIPNERAIVPVYYINDTAYQQTVHLADETNNSLTTYYPGQDVRFNTKAKNSIWIVTYDNRLAVFTDKDFKKLAPGVRKQKLDMRIVQTPVNSSEDFITLYRKGFEEE
jgi:hypothetical protein